MFRFLLQGCSRNRVRWVGTSDTYILVFPALEGPREKQKDCGGR